MRETQPPPIDYVNAVTAIGSVLLSIIFTHFIVIVVRNDLHHVLLPLLILFGGTILALNQLNGIDNIKFHTSYFAIWFGWLAIACLRNELDQSHEERVYVPSIHYQVAHALSFLLCLLWSKVTQSNRFFRAFYCMILTGIACTAENTPLASTWILYLQIFAFGFIYFFGLFVIQDSPEFCAVWCLFYDYPITLVILVIFQLLFYIIVTFWNLPPDKSL